MSTLFRCTCAGVAAALLLLGSAEQSTAQRTGKARGTAVARSSQQGRARVTAPVRQRTAVRRPTAAGRVTAGRARVVQPRTRVTREPPGHIGRVLPGRVTASRPRTRVTREPPGRIGRILPGRATASQPRAVSRGRSGTASGWSSSTIRRDPIVIDAGRRGRYDRDRDGWRGGRRYVRPAGYGYGYASGWGSIIPRHVYRPYRFSCPYVHSGFGVGFFAGGVHVGLGVSGVVHRGYGWGCAARPYVVAVPYFGIFPTVVAIHAAPVVRTYEQPVVVERPATLTPAGAERCAVVTVLQADGTGFWKMVALPAMGAYTPDDLGERIESRFQQGGAFAVRGADGSAFDIPASADRVIVDACE